MHGSVVGHAGEAVVGSQALQLSVHVVELGRPQLQLQAVLGQCLHLLAHLQFVVALVGDVASEAVVARERPIEVPRGDHHAPFVVDGAVATLGTPFAFHAGLLAGAVEQCGHAFEVLGMHELLPSEPDHRLAVHAAHRRVRGVDVLVVALGVETGDALERILHHAAEFGLLDLRSAACGDVVRGVQDLHSTRGVVAVEHGAADVEPTPFALGVAHAQFGLQ